jgi:hypothetical protein
MPQVRVVERMPEPSHRRRKRLETAVEIGLALLMVATGAVLGWVLW